MLSYGNTSLHMMCTEQRHQSFIVNINILFSFRYYQKPRCKKFNICSKFQSSRDRIFITAVLFSIILCGGKKLLSFWTNNDRCPRRERTHFGHLSCQTIGQEPGQDVSGSWRLSHGTIQRSPVQSRYLGLQARPQTRHQRLCSMFQVHRP